MDSIINLAISGNGKSMVMFQNLVSDDLNDGSLFFEPEILTNWFHQYPPFFSLHIDELLPLPGYASSHIITLSSRGIGGASFWVLETSSDYIAYPLYSNLGDYFASSYETTLADLTGDRIPEFIINIDYHNGTLFGHDGIIYDLSQPSPTGLNFGPEPPLLLRFSNSFSVIPNPTSLAFLRVNGGGWFLCLTEFTGTFVWNGQWFEQIEYTGVGSNPDVCIEELNSYETGISDFERAAILQIYETDFEDVSPVGTDWLTGDGDLAPDAQDEFRYTLAMNHALLGHKPETVDYLTRIVNTPSISTSTWIEPAQTFLANYQEPADVYRACAAAGIKCDLRLALVRAVASLPLVEYTADLHEITDLGVTILANGYFDFDDDATPERWFVTRHHPSEAMELWILSRSDDYLKAMFMDTVNTLNPTLFIHAPYDNDSLYAPENNYVPFTIGNDEVYAWVRRQRDQEPYVTKLDRREPWFPETDPAMQQYEQIIDGLFAGIDPARIITQPQALAANPDFNPDNSYHYYLGLAYELLSDEENAVAAYLQAWQNCCDTLPFYGNPVVANPYAIMARAKLEPIP